LVSDSQNIESRSFILRPEDDWALIELETPIGLVAGYLSTSDLGRDEITLSLRSGAGVSLAGYPQIQAHVLSAATECGIVYRAETRDLILHQCATMWGDSGAPLLLFQEDQPTVIGIMSAFVSGTEDFVGLAAPVSVFRNRLVEMLEANTPQTSSEGPVVNAGSAPVQ
jgi:V8-like Glu-specific endopeptidase